MEKQQYESNSEKPLAISKTEIAKNKKKIANFVNKNISPKLKEFIDINNDISFDWEELLEKILDSGTNIDNETLQVFADIIAAHYLIDRQLDEIKNKEQQIKG
tara:strand:- start:5225 stop:5533 length:309 start_codon:yes stop_codon:yes gene_type:complete